MPKGEKIENSHKRLIIGTRGSRLALWQANYVKELLEKGGLKVTVRIIKTTGDKVKTVPLAEMGGKGLFLKEIEEALAAGKIDVGVHSLKDVPAILPAGFALAAVLKREDPRDVFLSKKHESLLQLPKKSRVGTSSWRRQAQLKNFRPDLEVVPLRGNVETRLRKLSGGEIDAMVLAAAGLIRLGYQARIREYLPTSLLLPAAGQGAIALETRVGEDQRVVEFLNDLETFHAISAERSFVRALEGDCRTPIAAYAEVHGAGLTLTGMVATPDGRDLIRDRVEGHIREAESLGGQLAKALFSQGAREILRTAADYLKNR